MSGFFFKKIFFDFEKMLFLARISPNKQWNLISNRTRRHLMTFDDIWDQNEENLIFLILLFWGKNLKIGKFSFVDICGHFDMSIRKRSVFSFFCNQIWISPKTVSLRRADWPGDHFWVHFPRRGEKKLLPARVNPPYSFK